MSVSVIIPTFNEGGNAVAILTRLDAALQGLNGDVLFIDDGTDDLPDIVAAMSTQIAVPVR